MRKGRENGLFSDFAILVDDEFQKDLFEKIDAAQKRIYLQCMSFDGDVTGKSVAEKLIQAQRRGVDVRLSIDCFTDLYVSDTYYRKKQVAQEVRETRRIIDDMRKNGIEIARTRPYGPFHVFFLYRNHKKLIIIDDSVYIGGINISDHNFLWHDFMVRFNNAHLAHACTDDFKKTLQGVVQHINLDGQLYTNNYVQQTFYELIQEAREEIILSSPYSHGVHLFEALSPFSKNVRIRVLTLKRNNFRILNIISPYFFQALKKRRIELYCYKQFSHAKFIIVDRKKVFFGSSNFGLDSLLCKEEIAVLVHDPAFVKEFYEKLYEKQQMNLEPHHEHSKSSAYVLGFAFSYCVHWGLLYIGKPLRVLAPLLKGEHLTWKTGFGAALVTAGAILMSLR